MSACKREDAAKVRAVINAAQEIEKLLVDGCPRQQLPEYV
jgi:hypothetical protein